MGLKFCYPSEFKDRKERYKLIEFESPQEKDRFSCVKCKDILIEPHQLDCGCRFCLCCLKECWNICPECNIDGKSAYAKKGVITYDKAAEREILELQTNCINKRCPHKCKLKDLQNHLDTCEYSDNRDDSDECEIILIKCDDCGEELSIEELNGEHKNINGDTALLCSNWRTVCPYECNGEIQENIKNHLKSCPCVCVDCPMKEAGCTKVLPRSEMDEHIRNEASNHMVLMMQEMNKLMRENNALKSEHQESSDKLKREIKELGNSLAYSEREITKLSEELSLCEKNHQILLNESSVLKRRFLKTDSNFGVHIISIKDIVTKMLLSQNDDGTEIQTLSDIIDISGFTLFLKLTLNATNNSLVVSVNFVRDQMQSDWQSFQKQISIEWSKDIRFDPNHRSLFQSNHYMECGQIYQLDSISMLKTDIGDGDEDLSIIIEILDELFEESSM